MRLSEMVDALHHLNLRMIELTNCEEVITVVALKPEAYLAIKAHREFIQHALIGYDEKLSCDFIEINGIRFVPDHGK